MSENVLSFRNKIKKGRKAKTTTVCNEEPRRQLRKATPGTRNNTTLQTKKLSIQLNSSTKAAKAPNGNNKPVKRRLTVAQKDESNAHLNTVNIKGVLCREEEYNIILKRVKSFLSCGIGFVMYITGVPGSGKTHTVTQVIKDLDEPYAYINCSRAGTKTAVFTIIGKELPCCKCNNLQSLRAHLHQCPEKHLILIDEVDFLYTKSEIHLYNLFELPFIEKSKLLLIVISNTLSSLSTRLESRVGKERIEFRPYTAADLQKIIKNAPMIADLIPSPIKSNLKIKLKGTNKSQEAHTAAVAQPDARSLELICKRVASSTGDVRKALEFARRAGSEGLIQTDAILKEINAPLLGKFVQALGPYLKLVLAVYVRSDPSDLLAWFKNFKIRCKTKGIPELDFISFKDCVLELARLKMIQMSDLKIRGLHYSEEFETAMKNDPLFNFI